MNSGDQYQIIRFHKTLHSIKQPCIVVFARKKCWKCIKLAETMLYTSWINKAENQIFDLPQALKI